MTVGERIKKLREAAGMTQQELAERAGYTHKASIQMIEVGKAGIPAGRLPLIADALGVSMHYLETGEESPEWADEFLRSVLSLSIDGRREMIEFLRWMKFKERQHEIQESRDNMATRSAERARAKEGRA